MCAGRSLIPGYTFAPLIILGRVKVGICEASSNWIMAVSGLVRVVDVAIYTEQTWS